MKQVACHDEQHQHEQVGRSHFVFLVLRRILRSAPIEKQLSARREQRKANCTAGSNNAICEPVVAIKVVPHYHRTRDLEDCCTRTH